MLKKFTEAVEKILNESSIFKNIAPEFKRNTLTFKSEVIPNGMQVHFDIFKDGEGPKIQAVASYVGKRDAVFSTLSDFAGADYGKEALKEIVEELWDAGIDSIHVSIGPTDKKTRDFAFDFGFKEKASDNGQGDTFVLTVK